tara:strand:+ start:431 stop:604 length:174 start_codon:yes stop_codon:yes gene_type:complete
MDGKGSRQRDVDRKKFDNNWDEIFGKKEEEKLEYTEEEWLTEFTRSDQELGDGSEAP